MTTALVNPWWVFSTAPQGWLMACMAPSPFWKAEAPMVEATIMWARAVTLPPWRQASGSHSLTRRIPSSATPWARG
jgi:hypothetical protein